MGWRGFVAAALLVASMAPLVPADVPVCDGARPLLAAPTRAAQDDARQGRDAPDAGADDARLTMPPGDGTEQGAYYWGWLDPPLARDGADRSDWYAIELADTPKTLMLELVSNYTAAAAMGAYGEFVATAYGPDATVHLRSTAGRVEVPDAGGLWVIHVTTDLALGAPACGHVSPAADAATPTSAYSNHGLYVGCRPVCVDDARTH